MYEMYAFPKTIAYAHAVPIIFSYKLDVIYMCDVGIDAECIYLKHRSQNDSSSSLRISTCLLCRKWCALIESAFSKHVCVFILQLSLDSMFPMFVHVMYKLRQSATIYLNHCHSLPQASNRYKLEYVFTDWPTVEYAAHTPTINTFSIDSSCFLSHSVFFWFHFISISIHVTIQ